MSCNTVEFVQKGSKSYFGDCHCWRHDWIYN